MKKPDLKVSLLGQEFCLFGKPGGVVAIESEKPALPADEVGSPDAFVEAVAKDAVESVVLVLYGKSLLTPEVIGAINEAMEAISNNIDKLGRAAKADRHASPFGRVAQDRHGSDDLEFDERLLISGSSDGAFVQGWRWVGNDDVLAYLRQQLAVQHGADFEDDILEKLDLPEQSLEEMLESYGVHGTFEKLKPFLPAEEGPADHNEQRDGHTGF